MTGSGHFGFADWLPSALFWILLSAAFIRVFIKRRRRTLTNRWANAVSNADVIGLHDPNAIDAEELRRAEEAVSKSSLELREEILRDHALLDRFTSLHGFDDNNMEKLVEYFHSHGIGATYFRQDTAPVGALTMGSSHIYEFYVQRGEIESARTLLKKYFES